MYNKAIISLLQISSWIRRLLVFSSTTADVCLICQVPAAFYVFTFIKLVAQTSVFSRHGFNSFSSRCWPETPRGGRQDPNSPESPVRLHWVTGGPNISMVSRTSARWSRNELTDTLRIRASSALHLLKHTKKRSSTDAADTETAGWRLNRCDGVSSHRQPAAGHRQLFADAAFPRLAVRRQGAQSDDGLAGRREGNVQRAAGRSRSTSNLQHDPLTDRKQRWQATVTSVSINTTE